MCSIGERPAPRSPGWTCRTNPWEACPYRRGRTALRNTAERLKAKINPLVIVIAIGVLIAALYFYRQMESARREAALPVETAPAPTVVQSLPAEPEQTVPRPQQDELPQLPPIDDSDAEVKAALADLAGPTTIDRLLVPDALIRKIVVTVDNLPSRKLAMRMRAVRAVPGSFVVAGANEGTLFIDARNFARYGPYVEAVDAVDPAGFADAYTRFYPLLQEAYEEIAAPGRQFHTRFLEVLDHLLATPVVPGPIELTRPHVFYEYADPSLESLSVGQKALIRMGPEHAARLKSKIERLRAELAARSIAAGGN
jgi:hypothetical protein